MKPDLISIDKMFGSSQPNEKVPYAHDMAAARVELKVLSHAVQAAEQASPSAIAPQGVMALNQGRAIWHPAEAKTRRELARAWLSWALPDRCASNARELSSKSALLGKALNYNNPTATDAPPPVVADAPAPEAPPADAPPADAPPADAPPPEAPAPNS